MRQKNWKTVYPFGSRTNIKCEIWRPGLDKPSHISHKNTPKDECLHRSPLGERLRFYSKSPPTTQFTKIQIELWTKAHLVLLTVYKVLYGVSSGTHLSCKLLASIDKEKEMKEREIMGYTCHPPIKGRGKYRHVSEINPWSPNLSCPVSIYSTLTNL